MTELSAKASSYITEQQKKFQALRNEKRRELIEKMGSQAIQKAEAKVKLAM